MRRRRLERLAATLLAAALGLGAAEGSPASMPELSDATQAQLALRLPVMIEIAAADPALAASVVPAPWLDHWIDAVLVVATEVSNVPRRLDAIHQGPLGPWPSSDGFARTVAATDPAAVAALLAALEPRLAVRLRGRGVSSSEFDTAVRKAARRLTSARVVHRASRERVVPVTPTQRGLARLGIPVVTVVQDQVRAVAAGRWGSDWRADAS